MPSLGVDVEDVLTSRRQPVGRHSEREDAGVTNNLAT